MALVQIFFLRTAAKVWSNLTGTLSSTVKYCDRDACRLMYQSIPKLPIPPPPAIAGHLTHVKLCTVGNLTQNEAHPVVGHLTLVPKRLSAVGNKRISQFFDSASEPRSRVIALVDSIWVFLLLSFYIVVSWNLPLFKVWSEDMLNKKFVVAENFAKLVSKGKRFCLYSFIS